MALAHPDSTTDDDRWECVDIKAVEPVKTPVTLDMIKNDPRLAEMVSGQELPPVGTAGHGRGRMADRVRDGRGDALG